MRRSNHSHSLCLSPEALCGILPQIRHRHPLPGLRREHVPFCGILSTGRTKTPHHKSLSLRNKIFSNSAHTRQPSLQLYAPIRVRSRRYQKNSSTCRGYHKTPSAYHFGHPVKIKSNLADSDRLYGWGDAVGFRLHRIFWVSPGR